MLEYGAREDVVALPVATACSFSILVLGLQRQKMPSQTRFSEKWAKKGQLERRIPAKELTIVSTKAKLRTPARSPRNFGFEGIKELADERLRALFAFFVTRAAFIGRYLGRRLPSL